LPCREASDSADAMLQERALLMRWTRSTLYETYLSGKLKLDMGFFRKLGKQQG
jgi:hypothetical protein